MSEPLLTVDGLTVRLPVAGELRPVLRDVSLQLRAGESLGLVGESGSGKSMTARSIDRLLPAGFSTVSGRFGTPIRTTITTGVVVAVISTFVPLSELAELVNIGTLFAFVLVAIGVLVLRRTRPELPRAFRCPGVPVVPILAVLTSFYLMLNLPGATWIRFAVWLVVGLVVYFAYGARHSRLRTDPNYSRVAHPLDHAVER